MDSYFKLGVASLLPPLAAALLSIPAVHKALSKLKPWLVQVIAGLIFGALAVVSTEWGIPINGAQVNCRDAAVLVAGLMFGAPAGIIAGIIGGVERWIAVAWGIGTFTRVACSVSTLLAGLYSAALRRLMFDDKRPGWLLSLAIGVVMEIFHLTMVFLTNMGDPDQAMAVVKACTMPMVIANGVSVMLAAMIVSLVSNGRFSPEKRGQARISQTVQKWLLVTVLFAFAATSYVVVALQTRIAETNTESVLSSALSEVQLDIEAGLKSGKNPEKVVQGISKNRHVGTDGFVVVMNDNYTIVNAPARIQLGNLRVELADFTEPENPNAMFKMTVNNEISYVKYLHVHGYRILSVLPQREAFQIRNVAIYVNSYMEILVFAILFGMIYQLIKKVVVKQIYSVNNSLEKITGGDLNEVVNVRSNEEFAVLSDDINLTVDTLKKYIDEASARIDKELEFAKNIQASALPSVFPAFPSRKDFDIYASMNPAKEVGGDFYDFYLTNNDTLNFLVADVSGKGIPAAMFMMRAKTELKSLTEADMDLADVFTKGNAALCEGNDAMMFVTSWQGSVDLKSGLLSYANAGHNPPLVRHVNGRFEYLKSPAGFVLAGMDGVKYKTRELQLQPGDMVFLYTDGVTEATDANNELYGEDRLLKCINSKEFADMEELCKYVKADVDAFVGEAPQFDDITMVAFKYVGEAGTPSIYFERATLDDITPATEFVEAELEKLGCSMKTVIQMNVALDEIFSNIVRYGYTKAPGPVTVSVKETKRNGKRVVALRFIDEAIPYNPLKKEDPDTTLAAEDRGIGGLGIFMVKKSMDDMLYRYENEQNILTLIKNLE